MSADRAHARAASTQGREAGTVEKLIVIGFVSQSSFCEIEAQNYWLLPIHHDLTRGRTSVVRLT